MGLVLQRLVQGQRLLSETGTAEATPLDWYYRGYSRRLVLQRLLQGAGTARPGAKLSSLSDPFVAHCAQE